MTLHKLASTDAFIVFDLGDAAPGVGPTRLAPKILVDGAELLARSATYLFAAYELQVGGASAGINARPEGRDGAVSAFVAEVTPLAEQGRFTTEAGRGLTPADLSALHEASPSPLPVGSRRDDLLVAGVVAGVEHAAGGLDGKSVVVEGADSAPAALIAALAGRGAQVIDVEAGAPVWAADADVLLAGSRAGVLDHTVSDAVTASAVVPWGPVPVTAKALASLRRRGVAVLPDFVVIAGPSLVAAGGLPATAEPADVSAAVTAVLDDVAGHPDGPLLGACRRAEAYLSSWRESLPFGRPIA